MNTTMTHDAAIRTDSPAWEPVKLAHRTRTSSPSSIARAKPERDVRGKPKARDDEKDDRDARVKDGVLDASARFDAAMARYASQQALPCLSPITSPSVTSPHTDAHDQGMPPIGQDSGLRTRSAAAVSAGAAELGRSVGEVVLPDIARYTVFPNAPGTAASIAIDVAIGARSAAMAFHGVGGPLARQLSIRRGSLSGALSGALGKPVELTFDAGESRDALSPWQPLGGRGPCA